MATDVPVHAVVGCLTLDSVVGADGGLVRRTCGGNALWAAVGAHAWDRRVGIVTRVGDDYPTACLAELSSGVDVGGLRRLSGPHPLHVAFAYRPDGSRSRRIPPDVLAAIPEDIRQDFTDDTHDDARYLAATPAPADIPAPWLAHVEAVHLPSLRAQSLRTLVTALRRERPARLVTVDSPWYLRWDAVTEAHLGLLREVDAVLPSEDDLLRLRPNARPLDAARELRDRGARIVVVKLGGAGSLVIDRSGGVTHVPAYPAETVDPTGAGDSFCGGFLVGLRETGDAVQAALYGTVAASFAVEAGHAIAVLGVARGAAEERLAAVADRVHRGTGIDPRRVSA